MFIKPLMLVLMLGFPTYILAHGRDRANEIMEDIEESIYMLDGGGSRATGFITTDADGNIVMISNDHVCGENSTVMNATSHDGKKFKVKILGKSPTADLCLLQAPKNSKPLKLANKALKNEKAYAVGYPLAPFMTATSGRVKGFVRVMTQTNVPIPLCNKPKYRILTRAIPNRIPNAPAITEKGCFLDVQGLFTTVNVDLGFSGSPLLNDKEEVIGVIMTSKGNIAWSTAVSIQELRRFLNYK